jgi:hypothetical protein
MLDNLREFPEFEEIMEFEPGPELNLVIARWLFDFELVNVTQDIDGNYGEGEILIPAGTTLEELEPVLPKRGPLPHIGIKDWSGNKSSCWQVAEKLRDKEWLVSIKMMPKEHSFIIPGSRSEYDHPHPDMPAWQGKIIAEASYMARDVFLPPQFAPADTAPHALCALALRVLEAERQFKDRRDA